MLAKMIEEMLEDRDAAFLNVVRETMELVKKELHASGKYYKLFPWMKPGSEVEYKPRYHDSLLLKDSIYQAVAPIVSDCLDAIKHDERSPAFPKDHLPLKAAVSAYLFQDEGYDKKIQNMQMIPGFSIAAIHDSINQGFYDKVAKAVATLIYPGFNSFLKPSDRY